ncbi:hypothetical protein [Aquabacterium sp. OR-4]|uniref:hypothetical protein n=1 Tax=Aquabacterium sp. OR-4 TaxID=2978127 RepID=UPI0021B358E2|nr:hypothetical protein [Aquabacterium sp. OR-4]MDT7833886.1 hypothetical protein [Aquabacterium sp. OR-4]
MKWQSLSALLASAGLMVACGGGGGSTESVATVQDTDTSITLSGTAAKGLMANADVKVHPVKADGTVDTATVLASTTTDSKGKYTLPVFKVPKSQPYVVKVTAKADGSSSHLDEVSKTSHALPSGFSMRTLLMAPSSATQTTAASVTPFSEMAVAAAAKATGGVTAANAQQAVSTVTQLLGFDPIQVTVPENVASATSDDQKKLSVMLTAVSQLANSGDLGCASGSNGAKTQCVVEALASAASTSTIKLATTSGGTTTDVSAKLGAAVSTVLADPALSGSVGTSTLATVVANLGCTTNCAAAATGTTPVVDATATAIAAAKLLFTQIKSDWTAMFSRGKVSSVASGALNQQAWAFSQATTDVRVPIDVMAKDVGAMAMGIDFYNDYKAGREPVTTTGRSRGDASQVYTDGSWISEQNAYPAGCSLYQDSDATRLATARDNANFIGCGARHYVIASSVNGVLTRTEWRHAFTITPQADGTFTYVTRARKRVQTCPSNGSCTVTLNQALQTDASDANYGRFSGTITPTLSASFGNITKLVIAGDLPAAFGYDSPEIDTRAFKHTLAFEGTQTRNADGTVSSTASGTLVAKSSSGATVSTVTIKPSSMMQLPVSFDANGNEVAPGKSGSTVSGAHTAGAVSLNLVFSNASAEFEGVFALTDTVWDKSQTTLIPTKATLSGALRTLSGGTSTEFMKGVFTVTATGIAAYDATLALSSSNSYRVDTGFVGTVTAPNRPTLEFSIGAGMLRDSDEGRATAMTLQYRTLVNGTPRSVVSITGTANAAGNGMSSFKLSEATSGLVMTWAPSADSVDLWLGDVRKIGTLNAGSGLLTFSDSSFISLDIGL